VDMDLKIGKAVVMIILWSIMSKKNPCGIHPQQQHRRTMISLVDIVILRDSFEVEDDEEEEDSIDLNLRDQINDGMWVVVVAAVLLVTTHY
jgi:hypothetical protein